MLHFVGGVHFPDVVIAHELVHVSQQVLPARLIARAVIRLLEHSPERLQPVDVCYAVQPLAYAALDRYQFSADHTLVGSSLVRKLMQTSPASVASATSQA